MSVSNGRQNSRPRRQIQLAVAADKFPLFFGLLRSGFSVDLTVGCSLEHMLCDQLGIAPDYLRDRAQTVFLNSSPVDDLASASVSDKAVISLSAAMPGLNGAIMRRSGPLSEMRRSISHAPDQVCRQLSPGRITLKLFNLVAKELGQQFLTRGVVVSSRALGELFRQQPRSFWQSVQSAAIDGSPCEVDQLTLHEWPEQEVLLKLKPN
jgi:hypothetical protein